MKSFLFSLTKKVKYSLTTKENAICDHQNYGPICGYHNELYIYNNSNTTTGSYSTVGCLYALKEKLFADSSKMKELEVYRI